MIRILSIFFLILLQIGCTKPEPSSETAVDVVLIGGGIMSATLGSMLRSLDPNLRIEMYERLDKAARESSAAWNNAGTGHAAFCELNYTPVGSDGSIDLQKAIRIAEDFEISRQYWTYLVETGKIQNPGQFIQKTPHMSFVHGSDNVSFLKKRYEAMVAHPFFKGMQYSEDHQQIAAWAPLTMAGRPQDERVAATRMDIGTDVDFGALTNLLIDDLVKTKNTRLHLKHEVLDLDRNADNSWTVVFKDLDAGVKKAVKAKFVFIGAGGGALPLLQKSGIEEAKGLGGFPVGGEWLITDKKELIEMHDAKVYGLASVGSPPMSVPHLDSRFIDNRESLLFGPFATFSTKFLVNGSWGDLPLSVNPSNIWPMVRAGWDNLSLVKYMIEQVLLTKQQKLESLREYYPQAKLDDWRVLPAGQRVQLIKKDAKHGGILLFGTELVSSADKSVVALLGASPGASVVVKIMLDVLDSSFKAQMATPQWQAKIREMVPSYGVDLSRNEPLLKEVRAKSAKALGL
jgi:malate dehydrogenase (quinone)